MKLLVICTGNSCRSQMAHGFLEKFDNRLEVYSAGVSPAYKVMPETIEVMAEKGIDIKKHTPHNVIEYLKIPFDYVITVCDYAFDVCPSFTGDVKHQVHMPYPDPITAKGSYEKRLEVYRESRDMIEKGFYKFYIKELKPKL